MTWRSAVIDIGAVWLILSRASVGSQRFHEDVSFALLVGIALAAGATGHGASPES